LQNVWYMRRAEAAEMDGQGIAVAALPLKAIVRRGRLVLVVGLIEAGPRPWRRVGGGGERNGQVLGEGAHERLPFIQPGAGNGEWNADDFPGNPDYH
jgi:hypothetical protein